MNRIESEITPKMSIKFKDHELPLVHCRTLPIFGILEFAALQKLQNIICVIFSGFLVESFTDGLDCGLWAFLRFWGCFSAYVDTC